MRRGDKLTVEAVLAFLGLAISIYLTAYHYAGVPLYCESGSLINCGNVLNSRFATLLGLPVALYGVAFFCIDLLLIYLKNEEYLMYMNLLGAMVALGLIYSETVLGQICEYCTAVHIIVFTLLAFSVMKKREYRFPIFGKS